MFKFLKFLDDNLLKWGTFLAVIFIPLYPKLPSVHINHVWVYIRLEDFLILFLSLLWLIQILRKKIKFNWILALPIGIYWIFGLFSFFNSLYLAPSIPNFFPKIAFLAYGRHIEYMSLFFIGFSIIRTKDDIKSFIKILSVTLVGIILYGIGQKYYIFLWNLFPTFFEKYSFCFPSFQTGNEQFAKGIALCLPSDGRITSTFGGHYDLAAFMVMVTPIFAGFTLFAKKIYKKIFYFLIFSGSLLLLIFTSSRISFIAYILGLSAFLIFIKQKKWILQFLTLSIILLLLFSGSTAKRFLETIRFTSVVTNNQGQVVGVSENSLPVNLRNKISKNSDVIEGNVPSQNLPTGSGFITLQGGQKTNVAVVKSSLSQAQQKELNLADGGVQISTISGSFLIQKALVYDISFTTRFQGEWPTAWKAFMRNPLLGQGFSTITLATDGEYFRILGESGALGFISLFLVFSFLGAVVFDKIKFFEKNSMEKALVLGLTGGIIGVLINGTFIDVLEASKVAEPMWLFSGMIIALIFLQNKDKVIFKKYLVNIFTNNILIFFYILIIAGIIFLPFVSNFFSADDFTWLRWAASSSFKDVFKYYIDAQGFFYRPIDKDIIYFLYSVLSFNPQGYRVFIYFLNFLSAFGVYLLVLKITSKKFIAFISSLIFLLNPSHGEDIYWIATISTTLSSVFILFGLNFWAYFRSKENYFYYFISFVLFALSLLSYEMSVIFIFLVIVYDIIFVKIKSKTKAFLEYIPLLMLLPIYLFLRLVSHAVSAGGDYAYSIYHLLPNFVGNLFGYGVLVLFGEGTLPFYTSLRSSFRLHILPITLGLIVFFILFGFIVYIFRKKIIFKNNLFIFGVSFFIISLLPFLGLGNLAERYDFLSSVGVSIVFAFIFINIEKLKAKFGTISLKIIIGIIGLIILLTYGILTSQESNQWQKAGNITQNALIYLRENVSNPSLNSSFYFINTPIRYDNAWVFPIGLSDGMWFIYRDNSIKSINVSSFFQAKALSIGMKKNQYFILKFDKNFNLKEIKK